MPTVDVPYDFTNDSGAGTQFIDADQMNANFAALLAALNGGLDHANLTALAGVLLTQLAQGALGPAMGAFSAIYAGTPGSGQPQLALSDASGFDVSGWFDNATHRYTPQQAGVYRLTAGVGKVTTEVNGGYYAVKLRKNGAEHRIHAQRANSTNDGHGQVLTALVAANGTTDYFDVVWENAGGAIESAWFDGELAGLT